MTAWVSRHINSRLRFKTSQNFRDDVADVKDHRWFMIYDYVLGLDSSADSWPRELQVHTHSLYIRLSPSFNISNYVIFNSSNTKSSEIKLRHKISSNSRCANSYFYSGLPRLWNAMSIIDLTLSFDTIKQKFLIQIITVVSICMSLL